MKSGDIVIKRNPPKHLKGAVGIVISTVEHIRATGSVTMVDVVWPGCKPFTVESTTLEVINEDRRLSCV